MRRLSAFFLLALLLCAVNCFGGFGTDVLCDQNAAELRSWGDTSVLDEMALKFAAEEIDDGFTIGYCVCSAFYDLISQKFSFDFIFMHCVGTVVFSVADLVDSSADPISFQIDNHIAVRFISPYGSIIVVGYSGLIGPEI